MDSIDDKAVTINKQWQYPRFFENTVLQNRLTAVNARHAGTVLRLKKGDCAIVCDGQGMDYLVTLTSVNKDIVEFEVIDKAVNNAEPDIYVRVFQCVPKSDKLDWIVQKATELGVSEIIPVISKRSVSRPDEKNKIKKRDRLQKIAEEAAKQSGRGIIPKIGEFTLFNDVFSKYKKSSLGIILYERGGMNINMLIANKNNGNKNIDIFIGSEGGFEEYEVELAEKNGIKKVWLGNRILRTETASITILSVLMNLTGNL